MRAQRFAKPLHFRSCDENYNAFSLDRRNVDGPDVP